MRFRVVYDSAEELLRDHDQQFAKGGLLVRGEPPAGLTLYAAAELEVVAPGGQVVVPAQVVQMFPGVGVALAFAVEAKLKDLVARARGGGAAAAAAAAPAAAAAARPAAPVAKAPMPPAPSGTPAARLASSTAPEKVHMALHGNKDERAAVLRDTNRTLHAYILRNPGLGADEVAAMARMTTISMDVLKQIAERREWAQRPEVAIGLVRNPTLPVPMALKLIDYVAPADLKQLAKDTRTREPVRKAALKKVTGS